MRVAPFRLIGRADESLYSVIARWSRYLGDPPTAHIVRAVYGTMLPIYDDMLVGMARLEEGGWLAGSALEAIRTLTLYPYYATAADEDRRKKAVAAMLGDAPWPHAALGSWRVEAMPPDRLRFCPTCMAGMLERHPDPWWRRVHQLPSVLVCPEHGDVLIDSRLGRKPRRQRYVAATPEVCMSGGAPVIAVSDEAMRRRLAWLATRSSEMLATGGAASLKDGTAALRRQVQEAKVPLHGSSNVDALAADTVAHWQAVLDLRPDWSAALVGPRWIKVLLSGGAAPPLHRLLLDGFLSGM